jgi:hypothetical protein
VALELMTLDDLNHIYVLIPNDHSEERDLLTVANMTDAQFRWWIVAKGKMHGMQFLPSMGRIGMETRLNMINRLVRNGVRIYRTPRSPHPPPLSQTGKGE